MSNSDVAAAASDSAAAAAAASSCRLVRAAISDSNAPWCAAVE